MEFRQHQEKEKQRNLAQAKSRLRQEEEQLESLSHTKEECQRETKKKKKDKINLKELSLYQAYLTKLHYQIRGQKTTVTKSQQEVEDRRGELLQKSKEKKVLESLKDTRLLDYKEEMNRTEQKVTDELARDISFRKKSG